MKDPLVDFSRFDLSKVLVDKAGIMEINPHRYEMQLLDGIVYIDEDNAVGFKTLGPEPFWARGHFPDRPLMPGVLMCECAAQLSCYFAIQTKMVDNGYVGLGGLQDIRFRGPVVPGDSLIVMLQKGRVRRNAMFSAEFQGYVDQTLVVDGVVKGVALGES